MTIDEFGKIDLRIGKVLIAEPVEGSEKLVRIEVDLGEKNEADIGSYRQIVAGIGGMYTAEELLGKEIVVVANLDPRTFTFRRGSGQVGIESQGMLLAAAGEDGKPVLLVPEHGVPPGSPVK